MEPQNSPQNLGIMADGQQQCFEGYSYFDTVPPEILDEVLVRLRVKLLLPCKCVCKHWLSVIESPVFVSKHTRYQKIKGDDLLLRRTCPTDPDTHGFFALFRRLAYSVPDNSTEFEVIGECEYSGCINGPVDGFFCLNSSKEIALWNPTTSEVMPISRPEYSSSLQLYISCTFLGLDPRSNNNNDLKVLYVVQYMSKDEDDSDERKFTASYMIYSVSTGSWRHIKTLTDLPRDYEIPCLQDSGTYLDGVYYWWHPRDEVISFDMRKETFRDNIRGPPGKRGLVQGIFSFLDDETRVCLYDLVTVETRIDIWVMERVSNTWTKLVSAILPEGPWYPPSFARTDGIILFNRVYSIRLNPASQEITKLKGYEYYDYSESLVSVGGREGVGRIEDVNIEDLVGPFKFRRTAVKQSPAAGDGDLV